MVYIGLKDIKSNGISYWLEKESTQLSVHSLASVHSLEKASVFRRILSGSKKRVLRDSIKVVSSVT